MAIRKWVPLTGIIINGHVGIGFKNGAFRWLLRRFPNVDIIFVQEGRYAKQWRGQLGGKYHFFPDPRAAAQPMTYVLVKKSRFEVVTEVQKNIRHGGQYPRELNGVVVFDKRSGQYLSLSSLHPDPLGKGFERANQAARRSHVAQVGEYVTFHADDAEKAIPEGRDALPLSAGDSNEWLMTTTGKGSARWQFSDIGMTPLFKHLKRPGKVDLMELFARFGSRMKAVKRRSVWVPVKGMDHPALFFKVKIRKF